MPCRFKILSIPHLIFTLTTLLIASFLSCAQAPTEPGDPLVERTLPAELVEEANAVVAGNNAFALDFYQNVRDQPGNLVLSPLSISTAFAMVYGGARTVTEEEIGSVFRFPLGQERLHTLYRALLASLDTGTQFDGYRLNIANRLWGQDGYDFLPAYLDLTRESYGAELQPMDFMGLPEACRNTINQWVADKTEDLIPELMPQGSINTMTRLVLTNALYFKGKWDLEFDPEETAVAPFYTTPGKSVNVDMMFMENDFLFASNPYAQVLELPYRGKDLSMILLVPHAVDGLDALEGALTPENLSAWMDALVEGTVQVYLPRFEFGTDFPLSSTLIAMGMPSAFDHSSADFSGINGRRDLAIQTAVHKAFIKVNEEGTEAGAATGISVGIVSLPPTIRADHPFLFLIHDNVTGSILFLGRVADPTAG